jgi:hypothetical protein
VIVRFNKVMACKVRQVASDVSASRGRYLDLKLNPEQAADLPEAKEWPALGEFIEAVNRCEGFCTSGCTASGVTPGGHEAPYVDIYLSHPLARMSPAAVQKLVSELEKLNDKRTLRGFVLELCDSTASLPSGEEMIRSLRLWFIGKRPDAEQAFALVLARLRGHDVADYIPLAEQDFRSREQAAVRFRILVSAWLIVVALCALLASRYGWLAGIGGALAGLILFPVLFIIVVIGWAAVEHRRQKR